MHLRTSPAILLLLLVACSDGGRGKDEQNDPDVAALLNEREAKDFWMGVDPASPLPDSVRSDFRGLSYYPFDRSLRFPVTLERLPPGAPAQIPASGGETREMERYGILRFTVGSTPCSLVAYRSPLRPDNLFIPFLDMTSGKETYGAGRYIDLERTDDDRYTLDFNRAYNPYCAYNPSYSCPRTPRENVLAVAVRAGERNGASVH